MTRFENVGVFIREKVWLENSLRQLAQAVLEANLFPYKYSNILKPSHSSYLSACEEETVCSEASEYKIRTPGNYTEESIHHATGWITKEYGLIRGRGRRYFCFPMLPDQPWGSPSPLFTRYRVLFPFW
jgi:hypothetical protein